VSPQAPGPGPVAPVTREQVVAEVERRWDLMSEDEDVWLPSLDALDALVEVSTCASERGIVFPLWEVLASAFELATEIEGARVLAPGWLFLADGGDLVVTSPGFEARAFVRAYNPEPG
jgi:hypothetical protein